MTFSMPLRTALRSALVLSATLAAAATLLAQDATRAPLTVANAKITLSGTSNIHDYTATTSTVRVINVQVAGAAGGADFWAAVVKPGALQAFEIAIPAASLRSTKDGLDKNMHKALKVKEHADIVFRLTRLEARGQGYAAVGVLRIAGVEKDVTFDIVTQPKNGGLAVSGSVDLLMTDFGIPAPKAMMGMLKTDPKVTIRFETVLAAPLT